jgi:hypothetical protein
VAVALEPTPGLRSTEVHVESDAFDFSHSEPPARSSARSASSI